MMNCLAEAFAIVWQKHLPNYDSKDSGFIQVCFVILVTSSDFSFFIIGDG